MGTTNQTVLPTTPDFGNGWLWGEWALALSCGSVGSDRMYTEGEKFKRVVMK